MLYLLLIFIVCCVSGFCYWDYCRMKREVENRINKLKEPKK